MTVSARSRVRVSFATAGVGLLLVFAFGEPPGGAAAQSNFVGGTPSRPDSSDMRALRLRFEAGVRSNWHSHAGWQILAAEEGRGRTQKRGGPIVELTPGGAPDYTAAGVVHWHGASPDEHVVQLTIMGGTSGPTSWLEPVSDDEYRGR